MGIFAGIGLMLGGPLGMAIGQGMDNSQEQVDNEVKPGKKRVKTMWEEAEEKTNKKIAP